MHRVVADWYEEAEADGREVAVSAEATDVDEVGIRVDGRTRLYLKRDEACAPAVILIAAAHSEAS